jgi:DNA-binding CsgD family transcriptional regulator/PAS domain-containing protein
MRAEAMVLDLVGCIYDAAGDAAKWPAFLDRLGRHLNSGIATFYVWNLRNGGTDVTAVVGVDEHSRRLHDEYYGARNVFLMRGAHLLQPGTVRMSHELCPDDEVRRSEYWNDFMVPRRLGFGINATLSRDGSSAGMLGLIRSNRAKAFDADEVRLLYLLLPHLQRAVQLHQRITHLEAGCQAAAEALNRWPLGVILLDGQGKILLMNRSAEGILNQRDGLGLDQGRLVVSQPGKTAVLQNLIRCVAKTTLGCDHDPGGALALPRPSGKRPLQVLVAPACANRSLFPEPGAAAALFVSDPESMPEPEHELLRRLYGLTPAETRVAALLLTAKSLPEIADESLVTLNTVKTHTRRVFEKIGVRGQAEFLRLVLRSPALVLSRRKNHPIG